MENITINYARTLSFIDTACIEALSGDMEIHNKALWEKSGKGNDFLGWVTLPGEITNAALSEMEEAVRALRTKKTDLLVVIGIGGSYLGARAVIDALSDSFAALKPQEAPLVLYAGQNIGEDYLDELRGLLKNRNYALLVISKSGTTTEPALAFRLLKQDIEEKYGKKEACERIIAITDASRGALRKLAQSEGYRTFVIPDDVGGRYSVLTPVGLVAIAVAGFDIRALVKGAADMAALSGPDIPFSSKIGRAHV